jgi:arsenate reductase-like glutaredoxin family protein
MESATYAERAQIVGMEVQIFGVKKSAETRHALRFFAERRIRAHFVDLTVRSAAPGELRRFVQRFGVERLIDRESRRFRELGLHAARHSEERWLDWLVEEPLLLRMPLVRNGQQLTVGACEDDWRRWVESARRAGS